jgi:hypothetical protein
VPRIYPLCDISHRSAIVAGTAADNLATFKVTQNDTNLGVALWDPKSMLWPDILKLVVGVVLFLFSFALVVSYCCGAKAVSKVESGQTKFSTIAAWVSDGLSWVLSAVAGVTAIEMGKNPLSLQNQSCSPTADANQPLFPQVNLSHFCVKEVSRPVFISHRSLFRISPCLSLWDRRLWPFSPTSLGTWTREIRCRSPSIPMRDLRSRQAQTIWKHKWLEIQ